MKIDLTRDIEIGIFRVGLEMPKKLLINKKNEGKLDKISFNRLK